MSLQYRFFCVPVTSADDAELDLNAFLQTVQVITVHRDLICQESRYYLAIAVEYTSGRPKDTRKSELGKKKVDYKEVLSPEDFAVYAKLREWRKETATREAVPLYSVFKNDQMAAMVQNKVRTKAGLKDIQGVGEARIAKYGDAVLEILTQTQAHPEGGQ